MKRSKLYFAIIIIFSLILSTNASALENENKCELKEVSFGYQPFGNNLPIFVAAEKGFFSQRGIQVNLIKIISANDAANAIVNGAIIGDATIPLNVVLNIEENQPGLMKIFMMKATSKNRWSDYLLVKKGSKIKSITQLKNNKLGGYPGSAQQSLNKLILSKFMDQKDMLLTEIPPNLQLQALDAGQIAGLVTFDEIAIQALQDGIAEILEENPIGKHVIDPMYGYPYVLSSKFIKENPQCARLVRDAMYDAIEFIKTNEAEARQIMSKWVGTKPEIATKVQLWEQVKAEDIDKNSLQKLADIFYNAGITKKRIDTSTLYLTDKDFQ